MRGGVRTARDRQSNLELLRIVAMLAIIVSHFTLFSGYGFDPGSLSVNRLWIESMGIGNIGVNIFVLISGYFLSQTRGLKLKKAIQLWLQLFFYSAAIYLLFVFLGLTPFSRLQLLRSLCPVISEQWWFASTYFMLFLLSPWLNLALAQLDRRGCRALLALLTVCWSVIPTVSLQRVQSSKLLWFVYLYTLAAYIRRWARPPRGRPGVYLWPAAAVMALACLSVAAVEARGLSDPDVLGYTNFLYDMQRLPMLLAALLLFLGFREVDLGRSRGVNLVSSATFGVYLIHEQDLMRQFLWHTLLPRGQFGDSPLLIPYTFLIALLVFAVCALLELARRYVLEARYLPLLDRLEERLASRFPVGEDHTQGDGKA